MKAFHDEVLRRFPEIRDAIHPGDEDLPYLVVSYVIDWLRNLSTAGITPDITQRVLDFSDWCLAQPQGKDASDDIPTIWTVAFYEKLFRSETTRSLIPSLSTKEDLQRSEAYLRQWAGDDNYEAALKLFA